jgi:hypothetical protein
MSGHPWTTLSDVPAQPVEWLWEGRIPCGKLTLLDGEPGSGKSSLALDLAARVSRGAAMPMTRGAGSEPADVIVFNDDDNLADTIRPRLEAAGAELSRVHGIDRVISASDVAPLKPGLIVIDPLSAYLCLTCPNSPPRQAMKDLARLARETGAAVLAVQYLPKGATTWTGEIYDAARSILAISSIGHGRRRLAVTKSNLRPLADVIPLVYLIDNSDGAARVTGWSDGL